MRRVLLCGPNPRWTGPHLGLERSRGPGPGQRRSMLNDAVAHQTMWPSPASRDYRHPNAKPYSERGGGTKGEQLPNAVGGALNPTWVELLQGFPPGWTEV